jgi:hypothetical protein
MLKKKGNVIIMADLLNKVFMVFVRPFYNVDAEHKVFHRGTVYASTGASYYSALSTNNTLGQDNSPDVLNSKGTYRQDPWFLYATYTSYTDMRESLKSIIAFYGTSNVRCCIYIPVDYEVLPNE